VAELHRFGFAKLLTCGEGSFRPKFVALLLVVGSSLPIQPLPVSAQSARSPQTKKTPQNGSNPPISDPAGAPPAQIWLPPVQAPAHAPVIGWDGQLLTIDAENSSLSDVLLAIRSRTGASIEMPASTNRERIAIHLGPAPIREVISSLLYGTDFNYVIQSSETDETALGKVIITARESDASDNLVAGDGRSNSSNPKVRLMPGYAAPGKRDFEVSLPNPDESSSNVADAPAAEPSAPAQEPPPATTAADSHANATGSRNEARPVTSTAEATDSSSSSDSPALTAAEPISAGAAGTVAGNDASDASSESGTPSISHMEQTLQHMYQQRQQLQAQQNRPAPTPSQ